MAKYTWNMVALVTGASMQTKFLRKVLDLGSDLHALWGEVSYGCSGSHLLGTVETGKPDKNICFGKKMIRSTQIIHSAC